MENSHPTASELLRQEGLRPDDVSAGLLEQIHRIQQRADRRERFWFRTAAGFWIVAAVCFVSSAILLAMPVTTGRYARSVTVHEPGLSSSNAPVTTQNDRPALIRHATCPPNGEHGNLLMHGLTCALLLVLAAAVVGGILASIQAHLARREAGNAVIQHTLTGLIAEVRALGSAKQR